MYALRSIGPACVSKEFAAFAANRTAPVTVWLRALAADAHETCGGPGVGALGMCFTGGFALGMMLDDRLIAPVLSQPSLPIGFTKKAKRGLNLSEADLARVKERAAEGVCVLGLRFTKDIAVPADRFQRLRDELGDNFIGVEIDSSKGNEWGYPHQRPLGAHRALRRPTRESDRAGPRAGARLLPRPAVDRILSPGVSGHPRLRTRDGVADHVGRETRRLPMKGSRRPRCVTAISGFVAFGAASWARACHRARVGLGPR